MFKDLVEETHLPTSIDGVSGRLTELETLQADYEKKEESCKQAIRKRERHLQLEKITGTWDEDIDFSYDAELAADMDAIRTLQKKVRQRLGFATRISLLDAVIAAMSESDEAEEALAEHRKLLEKIQEEKNKRDTIKWTLESGLEKITELIAKIGNYGD